MRYKKFTLDIDSDTDIVLSTKMYYSRFRNTLCKDKVDPFRAAVSSGTWISLGDNFVNQLFANSDGKDVTDGK